MRMRGVFIGLLLSLMIVSSSQRKRTNDVFAGQMRLFSGNMYRQLVSSDSGDANIVYSPLSVYHTLGMLLAGTERNTSKQLMRVMELADRGLRIRESRVHSLMSKLFSKSLEQSNGQTFIVANAMFANQRFSVLDTYLSTLRIKYRAHFERVNMSNPEKALQTINQWAMRQTRDKITNLVEELNPLARLVLANAVYFKATWKYNFNTTKQPFVFVTNQGPKLLTETLTTTATFHYTSTDGMEFIAIPYFSTTSKTSYFIVGLPQNNLDNFNERAGDIMKSLEPVSQWITLKRKVTMPKFEINHSIDLKRTLLSMGVNLFDEDIDLNGVSNEPLFVSQFAHKAYINVNEGGTEAAAATVAELSSRSLPLEPPHFSVDRPFFFAIYNEAAKIFTFMGKINDPQP